EDRECDSQYEGSEECHDEGCRQCAGAGDRNCRLREVADDGSDGSFDLDHCVLGRRRTERPEESSNSCHSQQHRADDEYRAVEGAIGRVHAITPCRATSTTVSVSKPAPDTAEFAAAATRSLSTPTPLVGVTRTVSVRRDIVVDT